MRSGTYGGADEASRRRTGRLSHFAPSFSHPAPTVDLVRAGPGAASRRHIYVEPITAPTRIQPVLAKPLLRGVFHQVAFSISLVIGTLLIVGAQGGAGHVAASIFAASVTACFGISALYHRISWSPPVRMWMRRLDHAGIYLLKSGRPINHPSKMLLIKNDPLYQELWARALVPFKRIYGINEPPRLGADADRFPGSLDQ